MNLTELELSLRALEPGRATADLRLRGADHVVADLISGAPISFDFTALRAATHNLANYGVLLTRAVFAAQGLHLAWVRATGFAAGAGTETRLRLHLDPNAPWLHSLRWEALQDPQTGATLCRSERVLFVRYLETADLGRMQPPPRSDLSALVAVANPSDLAAYKLEAIDAPAELRRVGDALGDIPRAALGGAGERPTLNAIIDRLREGRQLLYLTCHGTLAGDEPYLWLEAEDGTSDKVAAKRFAQRIESLPSEQRPLLVILASCRSAGQIDDGRVLAALGPRLAALGVGAVIGMQSMAPIATLERLMPRLLALIREDGRIDRALAIVRQELHDDEPWWMPVLYTRLRDVRLWPAATATVSQQMVQTVAGGLDALLALLQTPAVRGLAAVYRSHVAVARAQVGDVIVLKEAHDILHTLQFKCYNPITRLIRLFPDDESVVAIMADNELTLSAGIDQLTTLCAESHEVFGDASWVRLLAGAATTLRGALENLDRELLKRAMFHLNRVFDVQPSIINANLISRARLLRLNELDEAMGELLVRLAGQPLDRGRLARFEAGVGALRELREGLEQQVESHDRWQAVDRELRRVEVSLRHDKADLEYSWPEIRAMVEPLCDNAERWATDLRAEAARLDEALTTAGGRTESTFSRYRRLVSERFYVVDTDLKRLCSRLRELGDPLSELERMLT